MVIALSRVFIVTGLCERVRNGIMEGLRNFIEVDNHCALDVGRGNEGRRPFEVRRPTFKEECPEASIREGSGELRLRTEEVGWQGLPLVDADWHAFC